MTASTLFAELTRAGVTVASDGGKVELTGSIPAELLPPAGVLKAGLSAVASGATWYGCVGETGRVVELRPEAPVPAGVTLLACAGAARWDRVPSAARLDLPHLFDAPAPAAKPRSRDAHPTRAMA